MAGEHRHLTGNDAILSRYFRITAGFVPRSTLRFRRHAGQMNGLEGSYRVESGMPGETESGSAGEQPDKG